MRLKKIRVGTSAQRPTADRNGGVYVDTSNRRWWNYVSGVWRSMVAFLRDSSAPSNPLEGDVYLSSIDNKLRVYVSGAWQAFAIGSDFIPNSSSETFGNINIKGAFKVAHRDSSSVHSIGGVSMAFNLQNALTVNSSEVVNGVVMNNLNGSDKGGCYLCALNVVNLPNLGGVVKGYSFGGLTFVSNSSVINVGAGASFGASFVFDSQAAGVNPFCSVLLLSDGNTPFRVRKTGVVNLPLVPVYADNASALAGGLVDGDVYKTAAGALMVVSGV